MRKAGSAAVVVALLAVACASPPPASPEADEAMHAGNYSRALDLYLTDLERRPWDTLIREKAEVARSRMVEAHLSQARAAEREGDIAGADRILADALAFSPDDPALAEARARLADRSYRRERGLAKVRVALETARALEARGEPGAALDLIARRVEARSAPPDVLAGAASLRARISERLLAASGIHLAKSRPGLALVLARAAASANPGDPETERLVAETEKFFARAHVLGVRIEPFEDRTGGRADPARFRELLLSALGDSGSFLGFEGEAALVVAGSVDSLTVKEQEPLVEEAVHEPVLRIDRRPNPNHRRAATEVRMLGTRLDDAESTLEARQRELRELESLGGSARVRGSSGRRYGEYTEVVYLRLVGDARRQVAGARSSRDRVSFALDRARENLAANPTYLETVIRGRVPYTRTIRVKTATATAGFVTGSGVRGSATASVTARDTVSAGRPEAGLMADPDDLPSDAVLSDQALRQLADRLAEELDGPIRALRLPLLDRTGPLEAGGDAYGALELFAAFALLTRGGLEQDTAAKKIEERWGIDIGGTAVDIAELRYD